MKNCLKWVYKKMVPWSDVCGKINVIYGKMDRARLSGRTTLARYYCYLLEKRYNCTISPGASIGSDLILPHPGGIVIGEGSIIGKNVTIYQQVTIGQNRGKYPIIGDNVVIYAGAKIIGDVSVGNNSIIGANAVVTKNVPKNSVWGGIPAKEIKKRDAVGD